MWGPIDGPLTRIPLNLSWAPSADPEHWKGVVRTDADIVGVSLTLQGGVIHWAKSQQLPLGASIVGEPVGGFPIAFWIGRALQEESAAPTNLALYLRGAVRSTMVGEVSSATRFDIDRETQGRTGEALRLVRLGTTPVTECGFLFLTRSDVRTNRKGQWRLSPSMSRGLSGTLAQVLSGGRVGEARVPERADRADKGDPRQRP